MQCFYLKFLEFMIVRLTIGIHYSKVCRQTDREILRWTYLQIHLYENIFTYLYDKYCFCYVIKKNLKFVIFL